MRAFLFDLDGTLIDSMSHHHSAWVQWHDRRGWSIDERSSFEATAGRSNEEILRDLYPAFSDAERAAMADEKDAIYRSIAQDSLELIPGARTFATHARQAGMKLAVCTASTLPNMALAFQRHGIDDWVEAVVSPADGLRGKPHPDIFLAAAQRLGVAAGDCVVFEDAPLGIVAAQRAGMKAVALTTTLPASAFAEFDNIIATAYDFTSLNLSMLTLAYPENTP